MKITEIVAIPLQGTTPPTGWARGTDPRENLHTLIEIRTDGGAAGVGSAFTSTALVEAALQLIRPLAIGECALEPERLSEKLHQMFYWQGRGGAITHTISGVDIALWDILGKATGQPVARLLGGFYRRRIKAYASLLFAEPPLLRERVNAAVEHGYRAVKLGWNGFGRVSRAYDEELVRTARDAAGPTIELMVDAGGSEEYWPNGLKWALETARMLHAYEVTWFEEPLPPDDLEGLRKLREHSLVKIAAGEVITRRQHFRPLIETGAVDIVQPDVTKCGGLSEARRIAWNAYDHNVLYVPHGWNTAIGVAADLHLVAALPVAEFVEYQTPSPYIDDLLISPFQLDLDGFLTIPDTPGLGIELDPDAVARLSV